MEVHDWLMIFLPALFLLVFDAKYMRFICYMSVWQ